MALHPLVTIGMPVFNDVEFIEESIVSILNQTYKNFHLILSDDGSTDGSADICKKYALLDARITYIKQEKNLGISKNMEFLLNKCKTPFFMWAADDDLWAPNFIEILLQLLEQNQNAVVAFSQYDQIEQHSKEHIKTINVSYYNKNVVKSLNYFIQNSDDGFGYGLFRTSLIQGVQFPNWWWPCNKTALNNIFPSLCFYLLKGTYLHYNKSSLFYKRVKSKGYTNHTRYSNSTKIELIKYTIRRFYLCGYTFKLIYNLLSFKDKLGILRLLISYWFLKPIFQELKLALK